MWKQKIGISLGNHYDIPTKGLIKAIKQIGFEAISPEWKENADIDEIVSSARECGLEIQSIHAPYDGAAEIWSSDENVYKPRIEEMFKVIDCCVKNKIGIIVMHTWIGFETKDVPTDSGLKNFEPVINKAKENNIKIAFENTEGLEFLKALMEHFKDYDNVGFCWDSGHEMCYNYSEDLLGQFGDRLIMTHINDNLGISDFNGKTFWTDDLHLLPYDGVADWDYNIKRLKNSNKLEILNFELIPKSKPNRLDNEIYGKMTLTEYFTECYKRACKIAYKYIN